MLSPHNPPMVTVSLGGPQINSPLGSPTAGDTKGSSSSTSSSSGGHSATNSIQSCSLSDDAAIFYPAAAAHQPQIIKYGDPGGQLPLNAQTTPQIHPDQVVYLPAPTAAAGAPCDPTLYQQTLWTPVCAGGQPTIPVIPAMTCSAAAAMPSSHGEHYMNIKNGAVHHNFPLSPPPSPFYCQVNPAQVPAAQLQINTDRSFYSSPVQSDVSCKDFLGHSLDHALPAPHTTRPP